MSTDLSRVFRKQIKLAILTPKGVDEKFIAAKSSPSLGLDLGHGSDSNQGFDYTAILFFFNFKF